VTKSRVVRRGIVVRVASFYVRLLQDAMRVVSLLPAATEIVAALGCADALVGVSHECDFPPEVARLPRVTHCAIHGNALPSAETDRWVRDTLAQTGTLYTLDEPVLRALAPDVIVTQRLCDVCAVGYETVTAFAATLPGPPRVVNLEPLRLADVLGDVRRIGDALGVTDRAEALVAALAARIEAVRARVDGAPRRRCVLLEWIDPPFRGGHWMPELVELAGGVDPLGRAGEDAAVVTWDAIREAAPEVLVLTCCGYPIERTLADVPLLAARPGWRELPAVRAGEVWAIDGAAYFSRPGPRLVDSLEILAAVLHPARAAGPPAPAACQRVPTA
jgi:iron complex transport system substrate-binding protein